MKRIFTLSALLMLGLGAWAQTSGTLKGKLVDSLNKQSLKDAAITILNGKDSSVEVFTLAKQDGSFSMMNIPFGEMIVQVKFQGYQPFSKRMTFSKQLASVDLGKIYLAPDYNDLGNVTVTESAVKIKGDTTEFKADAFKTKPNAVAEDLLKKIPGMEVGKDGSIKAQGETVQRVLVDGKTFFGGNDPLMATRNLPPDVIDKIQVFDDLSDQSKFSGFDDGNRVKTINITTKKDKRKGYFGKAVAGAGTNGTYDENLNINRFNGAQQISVVGEANDINKQNFTGQNIGGGRGNRGGGGGNSGSGSGINTIWSGGLNYRDSWSPNADAYGSYFYNHSSLATDQSSLTKTVVTADSSTTANAVSSSVSRNSNHKFNFNIEDKFDSVNSMVFRPNFTWQSSAPTSSSSTSTIGGPKGQPINESVTKNSSYNSGFSISGANLQLRHRFAKRYRTLSLDLNFSASQNNGDGYQYTLNSFYQPTLVRDTLNQHYFDTSHSFSFSPTLSYTEPIAKNQVLEFRYSYNYNNSTNINNTYEFDANDQKFSKFDSLFSNSYKLTSNTSNANLSWRLQGSKFNLNVSSGFQFTDLISTNTTKNVVVKQNYVNFTPALFFTYNYTRTKSLRVFYRGSTGQPSPTQLQPVLTTSDAINYTVGNPDLKPQFTHSLRVLYSSFDPFTQRIMFATVNASMVTNDIQSAITQNSNGGRTTTYVNLGGTYNVSGYFNYGFPLKHPKSNLNFQTNINYNQSQSLIKLSPAAADYTHNYSRNTGLMETIRWTTNLSSGFDMNLSASTNYTIARSSLQSSQNLDYFTHSAAAEFTYYDKKGLIIASNFDYTYYGNKAGGTSTSVPLWTPSIAYQVFKNKAGEIRLTCFDVLNQNQAVSQTQTTNQFIYTKTNTLTRYFLLTFTFNLRNFAGGQQQRMPGMFRGMFGGGGMRGGDFGGGGFGGGRRGGGF